MPRQHVVLGRLVPRFTARRLTLILVGLSVFAMTLIMTLTTGIPSSPSLSVYDTKIASHVAHLPHISDSLSKTFLNPFRPKSHPPPHNADDEYNGASWLADWKWLRVPFSSSVTVDEDRALLPPLRSRAPIYCYYDSTIRKTAEEKNAESELLLTWRRAWWAQGFRPVILGAAEAMNNPKYDILQRVVQSDDGFKQDLMRWLAWETMGGGILAHYTLLPSVPRQDPLLVYLRRGEYPQLTRWRDLGNFLFTGQKEHVKSAVQAILDAKPSKLKEAKDITTSVPDKMFEVDKTKMPLAAYTDTIISQRYPRVSEALVKNRPDGLISLNRLITTHLHVAWQNRFGDGIEVLEPLPEHMDTLVSNALQLARQLASCSDSPMPGSCPPNLPKCTPCVSMTPMPVMTPSRFHNSSKVFSIGAVPHPWTLALLRDLQESFNVSWILQSPRDPWVTTVTRALLGTGVSSTTRLMVLKEIVAGDYAVAHSLWIAAEKDIPPDMSWYFGFALPTKSLDEGQAQPPVPDFRRPEKDKTPHRERGPIVTPKDRAVEQPLIDEAKRVISLKKSTEETKLRASLEAWSMADTEIWKFVRAFQSRRHQEREQWDRSEAEYGGGAGTENGRNAWNRWHDHR